MIESGMAIQDSYWDFDTDTVGSVPTYATLTIGTNNSILVNSTYYLSAPNSVYINDTNTSTTAKISFRAFQDIINGSVNFSFNHTNSDQLYIYTMNTSNNNVYLQLSSNKIYYYNGSANTVLGAYVSNVWNNVSIDFNSVTHNFTVYLNGTLLGTGFSPTNQNASFMRYLIFETAGFSIPKMHVDNVEFIDDAIQTQPTTLRKFPYPYKAALTISSDIDDTYYNEFYDIYDFLNTNKNITGLGQGVNLSISSNFWFSGNVNIPSYYKYTNSSTILDDNASIFLDYLQTGYFDTAHNWNPMYYNMSTIADFNKLNLTLNILSGNGIIVPAWINHGGNDIVTNVGITSIYWKGDDSSNLSTYHWNRTQSSASTRYLWEGGGDAFQDSWMPYPMIPEQLNDSSYAFRFFRQLMRNDYSGTPFNRNFSIQINDTNINRLINHTGYGIVYTHLGYNGTTGGDALNPVFDTQAISNLNNLSNYSTVNKTIFITTLSKLLLYAEVSGYLNYSYNGSAIIIYNVTSPVRDFTPTLNDLSGITFYVPITTNVYLGSTNVTSSMIQNSADYTGQVSISFPINRSTYPYPKLSKVGSYQIDSTGDVLWNRTYTRPSLSQAVNASIIPSSDSITVNITAWNITGDYYKKWNESSTNASVTTQHTIGDFPANTAIQIKKNGINWNTYTSNSTGYITFTYADGYSDIQFEAELGTTASSSASCTVVNMALMGLITTLLVVFLILLFASILSTPISDGIIPMFIGIAVVVIIGLGMAIPVISDIVNMTCP